MCHRLDSECVHEIHAAGWHSVCLCRAATSHSWMPKNCPHCLCPQSQKNAKQTDEAWEFNSDDNYCDLIRISFGSAQRKMEKKSKWKGRMAKNSLKIEQKKTQNKKRLNSKIKICMVWSLKMPANSIGIEKNRLITEKNIAWKAK